MEESTQLADGRESKDILLDESQDSDPIRMENPDTTARVFFLFQSFAFHFELMGASLLKRIKELLESRTILFCGGR